ncbi:MULTISPECIES: amidohydrolase family protein [unclassified Caulobacter]|uniref:amidohydrolase family protein n=1 Tax=unclassified Caulobacter TaxID=2648921 RepID=UPI0006F9148A|nr:MULTISPECIES: amidohydrolase family protein [unclassified Caulobacter]KQV56899.1 amidohydrolase [Caulobacter sp. Root342]KQV72538.1 amidohydrolase [Caulobacter sp. Root343]
MTKSSSRGVSRRRLFSIGGGAIAASGVAALTPTGAKAADQPLAADTRMVTATEGTNICAVVSPDGKTVAFDVYAMLWLVPIEGGPARRLTDEIYEIAQPDWSPDGKTLAFQSYRDGNFHVWTIGADGTGLKPLTKGAFDCREPRWSPDGKTIAFSSDRGGRYGVHLLDVASGVITAFSSGPGDEFEPSWAPDGKSIAFTVDKVRIDVQSLDGARRTVAKVKASADRFNAASVASPAFTPDGQDVVFTAIENGKAELRNAAGVVVQGEDVFPFRAAWLPSGEFVYTADGQIKRRAAGGATAKAIAFTATVPVLTPRYIKKSRDFLSAKTRPVVGIGSPALSPDGRQVAFRALNDLYLLDIGGGPAKALINDTFSKVDPAWSPDGKTLAYSSDKGGSLDLWLCDMATGASKQLTHFDGAAVSGAWSRDGKSIAFLSQNGGLFVADVSTGETRRLYGDLWEPGKPTWGPGDKTVAYAAFKPYSARFREGLSEILTVDVASGKGIYAPILPDRSLGTRGDDGPVWSPDGKALAYVFASRLHVSPVDEAGKLLGPPKPLNDEVTDAVSWSGDGKSLIYLSAGQLKLIAATGGAPKLVPHGLTWANVRPKGRMVVRAARLWDGKSPTLRENVDVLISDGRIAGVAPRGEVAPDVTVIDAPTGTVMPGLIDMHTHRQMQGYGYGDREGRLWLSLGVTTTRSPGGPAYHTVEDQEAIESGKRIGPRYYATGEAIDGSRIFYNFMRPVTEPGQMALELKRVEALSYDLIKTYVRLSGERQKEVIAWAHAKGLPLTSHYHYPALGLGMDGMEHLGATSRTGYSRTVSALGNIYQDVNVAFVASKAARTPTLFTSTALLGDDRSLVDDPRIKALYPPWEYARLLERAKQMASMDRTPILASLARNVAEVARTVRAGGRIVTGTDSPIDFNAVSLHMNLRAMVRYGMTPFEALVTATSASGEYLDEPLGAITTGSYADLVLIDGDPLARIEDAAKVAKVIKHGEVYSVADLVSPFAEHSQHAALDRGRRFVCEASAEYWWHEPDFLAQARASCCDGACGFTPTFSLQV